MTRTATRPALRHRTPLLALLLVAAGALARAEDAPPSTRLVLGATVDDEVTLEGPLCIDGSIALTPKLGVHLRLGQTREALEAWGKLVGRRLRVRGRLVGRAQKHGPRHRLTMRPTSLEAIDAERHWSELASWPEVSSTFVLEGTPDADGLVFATPAVAFALPSDRDGRTDRGAGVRVELRGQVFIEPSEVRGVQRLYVHVSTSRPVEAGEGAVDATGRATPTTRGIAGSLGGR